MTDIFGTKLIDSEVDGAIGASANLLLDDVLVDAVVVLALVPFTRVLCAGVEGLLDLAVGGWCATVVAHGAVIALGVCCGFRAAFDTTSHQMPECGLETKSGGDGQRGWLRRCRISYAALR